MLQGLYAGVSGINAQQNRIDAVASDLANVSTTGYKSQRIAFQDLLQNQPGMSQAADPSTRTGAGALSGVIDRDQRQGALTQTENPLDFAIEGAGYFQVRRANGQVGLTRDGSFSLDSRGRLHTGTGELLVPEVRLPADANLGEITVNSDGNVMSGGRTVGKVSVVDVPVSQRLLPVENNLLSPTAASGAAQVVPDARIVQSALESSNTDTAAAFSEMIEAQRALELNSRVVRTQDEILSIVNQMRRG